MTMSTSDHYFTSQPSSASTPTTHEVKVRSLKMLLAGDRGVFNQGELDWGTRVLIENADIPTGGTLLDLGCGGGAIAVALAMLRPDAVVWAVDVNERALDTTRASVALNKLSNVRGRCAVRCHVVEPADTCGQRSTASTAERVVATTRAWRRRRLGGAQEPRI
jgi:16S rRNA G1207 methylase RsmC